MSFMAATYRLCNSALGQQLRRSASTGAVRSSYTVSYAVLTEMGRFIWITQRNHSSLQIQAARLAHIRSTLDLSPGRGYYLSLPNRWSR